MTEPRPKVTDSGRESDGGYPLGLPTAAVAVRPAAVFGIHFCGRGLGPLAAERSWTIAGAISPGCRAVRSRRCAHTAGCAGPAQVSQMTRLRGSRISIGSARSRPRQLGADVIDPPVVGRSWSFPEVSGVASRKMNDN